MKTKALTLAACLMALLVVTATPAAAAGANTRTTNYSKDWSVSNPIGSTAVNSSGYVATANSSEVNLYDSNSNLEWSYSLTTYSGYDRLADIEIGPNGDVYVTEYESAGSDSRITIIDSNGTLVDTYNAAGRTLRDFEVIQENGNIIAIDTANGGLLKYNKGTGNDMWGVNLYGGGIGVVHIDQDSNNFYTYSTSGDVEKYTLTIGGISQPSADWTTSMSSIVDHDPRFVTFYDGEVYILDEGEGIYQVNSTGSSQVRASVAGFNSFQVSESSQNGVVAISNTGKETKVYLVKDDTLGSELGEGRDAAISVNSTYVSTRKARLSENVTPSVSSVDISIEGNTSTFNTTGANEFEANATATFSDGSTQEVSEDSNSSYTFNATVIKQLSPKDKFEGNNSGTTDLQISYTGPKGNTVTDNITINVKDPSTLTDVKLLGVDSRYKEGENDQLKVKAVYANGTERLVTDSATYSVNNTTRLTVNSTGYLSAIQYGDVDITATYTQSWTSTTLSATNSTTVISNNVSHIEFNVSDNTPIIQTEVDMSATLVYKDGRTKNITQDITATNVTSNRSVTTDFDFNNKTVEFSDVGGYRLTFAATYNNTVYSDTATVQLNPKRNYNWFNQLSPAEKIWVLFTDWSLLAIITSALIGGMVAMNYGSGAGISTFTIMLALCWLGGLVSIFVPATLLIFEVFVMVVLDVQMVDFS